MSGLELNPITGQFEIKGAAGGGGNPAPGGVGFTWNFDSSTTEADPGSGDFRLDTNDFATVAFLYISKTNADSVALTDFLAIVTQSGGFIKLYKESDPDNFVVFELLSSVEETDYYKIGISKLSSSGSLFSNGNAIIVSFMSLGGVWGRLSGSINDNSEITAALELKTTLPGSDFSWNFDDTITENEDPGAGNVRLNDSDPTVADTILLSTESGDGDDLVSALSPLLNGITFFKLYAANNPSNYIFGQVDSTPVSGSGYVQAHYQLLANNGSIWSDGVALILSINSLRRGIIWKSQWSSEVDYVVSDVLYNRGVSYVCTDNHTSATDDEPGVGVNWTNYWEPMTKQTFTLAFDDSDISSGVVTVTHNLGYKYVLTAVYDNTDIQQDHSVIITTLVDENSLELSNFSEPISGTWHVVVKS